MRSILTCVLFLASFACGPGPRPDDDNVTGECTNEGSHRCNGSNSEVCISGNWTKETVCPLGCADGLGCIASACVDAGQSKSYMGCEYWAVDLDNAVEVLGAANTGLPCNALYGTGVPSTHKV